MRAIGRCIGLDVHLDFCEVAVCEEGKVRSAGRVPSTPEALRALAESLAAEDRVAWEVTGSAWEIAGILAPHVAKVIVVPIRGSRVLAGMEETRHRFREALTELEQKTLDGFELVIEQLDRALESVGSRNVELAATVVADDDRVNRRYREIHEDGLSLLARQTPVASDLRLVAALLDIMRCIERMGDQCANIAKLVPLAASDGATDANMLATIERMGELVRSQVAQAEEAFDTRDVELARDLVGRDREVNRLDREVFIRAVEVGDSIEIREWAMFMILVARCLARIAENTVNIAEQTVFVAIGLFREIQSESQLA